MIGTVHNEIHPSCDGAEITDYEPVAYKIIKMGDMLVKTVGPVNIIVIGVVSYDDTWIFNYILDVAKAWDIGIRESLILIWNFAHFALVCHLLLELGGGFECRNIVSRDDDSGVLGDIAGGFLFTFLHNE